MSLEVGKEEDWIEGQFLPLELSIKWERMGKKSWRTDISKLILSP